jgi:SAM-dependent methyltransferase
MTHPSATWAVALFRRSVLKQAKLKAIVALVGDIEGKTCLDLGGDNGVISHLLRCRGGEWSSADLGADHVASIRELVGERVWELDGASLPFPDGAFDVVVVVDLLEHIEADLAFAGELGRVLKPGGLLVVNVPHVKRRSLINRIRTAVGLTDAWHGHVRPGYTIEDLARLLHPLFRLERSQTYSKAFSEAIDVALNVLYGGLAHARRGPAGGPSKGTVLMRRDVEKRRRQFWLLSLGYPFLWAVSRLDGVLFWQTGYRLIVRARRVDETAAGEGGPT